MLDSGYSRALLTPVVASGDLTAAREALGRHDWQVAYDAASVVVCDEPADDAERHDVLADAAWWLGRIEDCIEHREAAYRTFDEGGDHRRAGMCAVWLYEHHMFLMRGVIAVTWLRRARRALAEDTECVPYGALILREVEVAHGSGELERATTLAADALALGRRLRSPDIEAQALQALGRVLIDSGEPAEGLAHLDEAMLFGIEGRLDPYSTGKVYCSLIGACEDLGDLRRAAEWTEATSRWAENHPFAIFPGICRVHRALALGSRGALADAEREASRACDELMGVNVPNAAAALAEVGDIRRRLGDLAGAEEAFGKAEALCGQPCAGLALLRLAEGRVEAARSIIERCLDGAGMPLPRARLLPAFAQIAIAGGDLDIASDAVAELEQIAAAFATPALVASTRSARGRLDLALGDAAAARSALQDALKCWQDLDVPYEVASARTLLGHALVLSGDADAAAASFAAAEAQFDEIGAQLDVRQIREIAGRSTLPAGLTGREVEVLRLIAAGRTNKEIAAALFLSEKTVSRHLSNIFSKIGVSSRAAATAFAFQHELVNRRS